MERVFISIGVFLLVASYVIGIGYGLYLWGGEGVAFSVAVWTAFKLWMEVIVVAIVSIFAGYIIGEVSK